MTASIEVVSAELDDLKAKVIVLAALIEKRNAEIADMAQSPFAAMLDHPIDTVIAMIRKCAPHIFSHNVAIPAAPADVPTLTNVVSPAAPIDALMTQVAEARAPG